MLALLAASLIAQARLFDTIRAWNTYAYWNFAYIHAKEENAALFTPAISFSTELGICNLSEQLASIRSDLAGRRPHTQQSCYNRARFRLESFF